MNLMKFAAVLSAAVLCTSLPLTGCAEQEPQILYEDVAEICFYKRPNIEQAVQIPLIVNQQIDDLIVSELRGEQIDSEHIDISCGLISEEEDCYVYIISLSFLWDDYAETDANVVIDALDLLIGGKTYEYDFGRAVILNEICQNSCDALSFGGLGTGYSRLNFLEIDLEFQEDVTLLSIDNTIALPLTNVSEFLKDYTKGTREEILLTADDSNFKKLYYAFDFSVRYRYNNEKQKLYFVAMPVQSDIIGRLPDFLKTNPLP